MELRQNMALLALGLLALINLQSCKNKNKNLIEDAPLISTEVVDNLGRKVLLRSTPQKIVSLAPSITEMVFAMGAQGKLLARSQACDYPEEASAIQEVVTYPEVDFESLIIMEPDLVLGTTEILPPKLLPIFDKFKVPVFFQSFDSLEAIEDNIRTLGRILDMRDNGDYLADSLMRIRKRIEDSTFALIKYPSVILVSIDPLIVVGGKGYLNEMLEKAGSKNAFGDLQENYPKVTVEALLKANPEYLILPTRNDNDYPELLGRYPALKQLKAAGLKQVFIIDPDLVYRPGPRSIEGLAIMTNILHSRLSPSGFFTDQ